MAATTPRSTSLSDLITDVLLEIGEKFAPLRAPRGPEPTVPGFAGYAVATTTNAALAGRFGGVAIDRDNVDLFIALLMNRLYRLRSSLFAHGQGDLTELLHVLERFRSVVLRDGGVSFTGRPDAGNAAFRELYALLCRRRNSHDDATADDASPMTDWWSLRRLAERIETYERSIAPPLLQRHSHPEARESPRPPSVPPPTVSDDG